MVRNAYSCDSSEIVGNKEATILKFTSLAEKFGKLGWTSCDKADDAKEKYNEFAHGDCVRLFQKFEKFDHLINRLDLFIFIQLIVFYCSKPHFASLQKVWKVVFVLFQEQAGLERGFSVNLKVREEFQKVRNKRRSKCK